MKHKERDKVKRLCRSIVFAASFTFCAKSKHFGFFRTFFFVCKFTYVGSDQTRINKLVSVSHCTGSTVDRGVITSPFFALFV